MAKAPAAKVFEDEDSDILPLSSYLFKRKEPESKGSEAEAIPQPQAEGEKKKKRRKLVKKCMSKHPFDIPAKLPTKTEQTTEPTPITKISSEMLPPTEIAVE